MSIYLDHHAAAPLAKGVAEVIRAARESGWANASSAHTAGRAAREVLERAREQVAAAVGARPADLVLTSGGTEACNLGVFGLLSACAEPRVLRTRIEHPAVASSVARVAAEEVLLETPGGVAPDELPLHRIDLACIQWVNHETGTVLPVERYAAQCRDAGVPLFVDACQALGKLPVDVQSLGATAVAFGSSKIGGPHGAGALWIKRGTELLPQKCGGGQERGRRAGTACPATIAGFGHAAQLVPERLRRMPEVRRRRDRIERELGALTQVNGASGPRVSTVSNLSARAWSGPRLVAALDLEGLMVAHGAACSSGVGEPSEVVSALHPDEPWRAESALRISLGVQTTDAEIGAAIEILTRVICRKSGFE